MIKLNIGGHKRRQLGPKGWKILDIHKDAEISINIEDEKLPFEKNSVDAIYSSHTLEHIYPDRVGFVLKEWHRVLKPGGKIRVVVPDIDRAVKAYATGNHAFLRKDEHMSRLPYLPDIPLCWLASWFFSYSKDDDGNRIFTGHKMAFNRKVLDHFLKKAGFKDITKSAYGKASPIFKGWDFDKYKLCSVYAEATK